jgi:hypothetical protein
MGLSSPNRIVWLYFGALRRSVLDLDSSNGDDERKGNIAICIMLAVSVVEAFLNVLFRVAVSEPEFASKAPSILKDLQSRKTLDSKLKDWPARIFGKGLDLEAPHTKAFFALKERRNRLMHFTSSHQSVAVPGVGIDGLADTSVFDDLTPSDAATALEVAEDMVGELLRLRGIPEAEIPQALHAWTGRVTS